jgi:hypothetical protein
VPRVPPPLSRASIAAFAAGSAAVLAACLIVAPRIMLSLFATYDDEGYFLISIREWLDRGDLYGEVYSEYGPGYFALVGGVFRLFGLELDNDSGRAVTLVLWLAISVLAGATLFRLTGSPVIGVCGQILAFVVAFIVRQDPLYPGGWLALLLVSIVAAIAFGLPRRPGAALFAAAALATTAALIKINVGGLAIAAIAVACVVAIPALRSRRWLEVGITSLCIAVPFILISSELDRAQVLEYAVTVTLALIAVMVSLPRLTEGPGLGLRELRLALLGAALAAFLILGLVIVRGSSPGDLIEGMIVQPLDHRNVIDVRLDPAATGIWVTVAGLAAAVLARRWLRRLAPAATGSLRIAAGLWAWLAAALIASTHPAVFAAAGAFAWVAVIPPGADPVDPRTAFARTAIVLLAVLNLMQAYPVASNQLVLSMLPLVFVGGICVADGLGELGAAFAARARAVAVAGGLVVAAFAAWVALVPARDLVEPALDRYEANIPLGLPGAEDLRVTPHEHEVFTATVDRLQHRCQTFFGEPGMSSFYIWSGLEPPTGMNTGNWMYQFQDAEQRRTLADLERAEGLCILRNRFVVEFWQGDRELPGGPLAGWIDANFVPVDFILGYEILLPAGDVDG